MAIQVTKSMLQGEYYWTAAEGDDPNETSRDGLFFNRKEGYEVIGMIQRVVDHFNFQDEEDVHTIEAIIVHDLPGELRGTTNVSLWLVKHIWEKREEEEAQATVTSSNGLSEGDVWLDASEINQLIQEKSSQKTNLVPSMHASVKAGTEASAPTLHPCLELRWGDSGNDRIETDDEEVVCLSVSNPYANVTLRDFTVAIAEMRMGDDGPVPILPNGTPSVEVTPGQMLWFGDLEPGDDNITRETVLISKGARAGHYSLHVRYTYRVEFKMAGSDGFRLNLVSS